MKIFNWLGRASYYILWPGISLYLLGNQRSRIVVYSGDDILVVKGWLSSGKWSLPGGGLHKGEVTVASAIRELQEETDLKLTTSDIKKLASEDFRLRGVKVKLHFFSAGASSLQPIKKQSLEITEIAWIDQKKLNTSNTNKDALRGIALWKSS